MILLYAKLYFLSVFLAIKIIIEMLFDPDKSRILFLRKNMLQVFRKCITCDYFKCAVRFLDGLK